MNHEESQLLTIAEAAEFCGVSRRAFEYSMAGKNPPAVIVFKGKKLFHRDALADWNKTRPRRKKA